MRYPVSSEDHGFLSERSVPVAAELTDVLGDAAVTVSFVPREAGPAMPVAPPVYDIVVAMTLIVLYTRMLYLYKPLLPSVFKAKFYSYTARVLAESLDVNIIKLTDMSSALLILSLAPALCAIAGSYGLGGESYGVSDHIMPIALGAVVLVALWRRLVTGIVRGASKSYLFFEALRLNDKLTFCFWGLVITPITALTAFVPHDMFMVLRYAIMAALVLMVLHHTIELTKLFIRWRVSFLQYILYLCMVELLPISFIITVIQKSETL
ncbi:MAG: DUF4271 domain-containing protein [Rikenellaceae bacterium]|nr:DUF4271 domain-containing protein [Rikenellaceae bacterium]